MPMLESPRTEEASTPQSRRALRVSNGWRYPVSKETSLSWFLGISVMLFAAATFVLVLIPPKDELPPLIQVDLGFEGVENEPPPLGEPEAGGGEQKAEEAPQPPEPMPEPEPVPEEPMVEPPPTPAPVPSFEVPEVTPPPPPPVLKPVAKSAPKPSKPTKPATTTGNQSAAPTGSGIADAKPGVKGSPGGMPGGRGGGRGDFVSTPHPQYDSTARQRRYEGRGLFLITYQNGRIVSVSTIQSTGVPYLDAKTIAHVRSRFRVKAGVSGSARLPIVWQLK